MPYFQLPHRQWRLLVQNCHWKGALVRGFSDPNGVSDLLAPAEISHCIREAMPSALPHATPPDPILIQVGRSPPQEQIATCCRLIIVREDGADLRGAGQKMRTLRCHDDSMLDDFTK